RKGVESMASQSADEAAEDLGEDPFPLTRLAQAAINQQTASGHLGDAAPPRPIVDLPLAREILASLQRRIACGETRLTPFVPGIEIEIAIAAAEGEATPPDQAEPPDPLFRLRMHRWAMAEDDLAGLVPLRDPRLRVLDFDYDVAGFMQVRTADDLPASP